MINTYIDKETDPDEYNKIKKVLKSNSLLEQFKGLMCPRCKHSNDKSFTQCHICNSINGIPRCLEFEHSSTKHGVQSIQREKLDKAISSIANKNRELASFQNK